MNLNKLWTIFFIASLFWACSDSDKTAGGTTEDAGIIADLNVAGLTQKGPFVKGSAVTVQGIDCKTMEFTDEKFEGEVKSDKGDFEVKDVNLSSTCAVFEVSGNYLNELTGKKSSEKLTLHALTDLKDRKNVNINVLTELEYERVMNLVAQKKMPFAEAKEQAEKEVLASFNIKGDVAGNFAEAEDLNIFEKGEGNAALLAVSVMVQANASESKLAERLDDFSAAIAKNGSLEDGAKTEIANWAAAATENGKLDTIRKNIESWNVGDTVAAFETFITAVIPDGGSVILSGVEGSSSSKVPEPVEGSSSSSWTLSSDDSRVTDTTESSNDSRTSYLNPNIVYGEMTDSRDGQVYKTIKIGNQVWMAQNLNYDYKGSKPCYERDSIFDCSFGRYYSWAMAIDSAVLRTTVQKKCGNGLTCDLTETIRGVCPEGWHLPDTTEFKTFFDYVVKTTGDSSSARLKTVGEWTPYVPEGGKDYIAEGTNAIGFSIRPSGCYYCEEDNRNGVDPDNKIKCHFDFIHELTRFWASNDVSSFYAFSFVTSNDNDVMRAYQKTSKLNYYSVRCIQDNASVASSSSSSQKSSSFLASSSSFAVDTGKSVSSSSKEELSSSVELAPPCRTRDSDNCEYGSLTDDRDGQIYKTVKIGKQWWMAENLNYAYTDVPYKYKEDEKVYTSDSTSWCYGDNSSNCAEYGRFYTWAAAMDSAGTWSTNGKGCGYSKTCSPTYPVRGVCPAGWHLPDRTEWMTLFTTVGGESTAGQMLLKWTTGWSQNGVTVSNAYAFSALLAGIRSYNGEYIFEGEDAYFWSSTEYDRNGVYYVGFAYGVDSAAMPYSIKYDGFPVRCVKD